MITVDAVTQYAVDVLERKVVAGKWVRLACQRHQQDLERAGTEEFPYVFDEESAEKVFAFFLFCRHVKGQLAGQRIALEPWQKFILGNIFGWIHKDTGLRRYRKSYVQVGRKNGKSTMLSGLSLYMLMADGEEGSEVYATATKSDQARIVYDAGRMMVTRSKDLLRRLEPGKAETIHPATGSKFAPLSKDTKSLDGLNPHLGIIDEYHAHPTSEMYDVIVSGMGQRTQPLLFIITTAGFGLASPCYEEYMYLTKVLEGELVNEQYFAYIAQLDEDDNPQDESVWVKANPLMATSEFGLEYLRGELKAALDVPSKMRNFLTKNLNMWLDQREDGYMSMDKWRACGATEENPMPDLTGRACYIGVDLSAKIDLTSVAIEFPLGEGSFALLSHSFIPKDKLAERRKTDKQPYDSWISLGWLTAIPGAVIDQEDIITWIDEQVARNCWEVQEVCVDPWNATQFSVEMQKRDYLVVEITQGIRTLSEPTKDFRELVLRRKIIHDGSPVMAWAMGNAIERPDHNGNIMLDKAKSRERIDPVASAMNAHARAMHHEVVSSYDPNRYAEDDVLDKLWN